MLRKSHFFNISILLANTVIMDILKQGITDMKTTKLRGFGREIYFLTKRLY